MMSIPTVAIPVSSDGRSYVYDPYPSAKSAEQVMEKAQYASINFQDNYQKMILQISVNKTQLLQAESAVWIFPIPAPSEDVNLDVISGMRLPVPGGHFVRTLAQRSVLDLFLWSSSTQIYPSPMVLSPNLPGSGSLPYRDFRHMGGIGDNQGNVIVQRHLERFGLATEIVEANSSLSLKNYLKSHSLTLPDNDSEILAEYIDKNYSFSISWINDTQKFVEEADPDYQYYDLGVCLGFPVERIFFPLKLTSLYGDLAIPIILQIIDPATVAPGQGLLNNLDVWVDYAYEENHRADAAMIDFYAEQIERDSINVSGETIFLNLTYTLVIIEDYSYKFTDDIWFVPDTPMTLQYDTFFVSGWPIVAVLSVLFASMFSSLLAGMWIYRGFEPSKWKFALLGLTNLLTILGFIIVSSWLRINKKFLGKSIIEGEITVENTALIPPPLRYFFISFALLFMSLTAAISILLYFSL